jgi:hypothetical protein
MWEDNTYLRNKLCKYELGPFGTEMRATAVSCGHNARSFLNR